MVGTESGKDRRGNIQASRISPLRQPDSKSAQVSIFEGKMYQRQVQEVMAWWVHNWVRMEEGIIGGRNAVPARQKGCTGKHVAGEKLFEQRSPKFQRIEVDSLCWPDSEIAQTSFYFC